MFLQNLARYYDKDVMDVLLLFNTTFQQRKPRDSCVHLALKCTGFYDSVLKSSKEKEVSSGCKTF